MLYFIARFWTPLSNLLASRAYHGCAKIKRFNRDFIVVFGGSQTTSIEYYDINNKSATWELSIRILPAISWVIGSVVTMFDDERCDAFIASYFTKSIFVCSGKYIWAQRDVAYIFPNGTNNMAVMDASLFPPYFI